MRTTKQIDDEIAKLQNSLNTSWKVVAKKIAVLEKEKQEILKSLKKLSNKHKRIKWK